MKSKQFVIVFWMVIFILIAGSIHTVSSDVYAADNLPEFTSGGDKSLYYSFNDEKWFVYTGKSVYFIKDEPDKLKYNNKIYTLKSFDGFSARNNNGNTDFAWTGVFYNEENDASLKASYGFTYYKSLNSSRYNFPIKYNGKEIGRTSCWVRNLEVKDGGNITEGNVCSASVGSGKIEVYRFKPKSSKYILACYSSEDVGFYDGHKIINGNWVENDNLDNRTEGVVAYSGNLTKLPVSGFSVGSEYECYVNYHGSYSGTNVSAKIGIFPYGTSDNDIISKLHGVSYAPEGEIIAYIGEEGQLHSFAKNSFYWANSKSDNLKVNGEIYNFDAFGYDMKGNVTADFYSRSDKAVTEDVFYEESNSLTKGSQVPKTLIVKEFDSGRDVGNIVINKVYRFTNENGGRIEADKAYSTTVSAGKTTNFYFTPNTTGKYTFATKGIDTGFSDPVEHDNIPRIEKDDLEYETYSLTANKTYVFHVIYDSDFINGNRKAVAAIFSGSTVKDAILSTPVNRDGSSGNNNNKNKYNSDDNDDDDDDGDNEKDSSGFTKGDSRTAGKGSSKAEYVKTGKDTVRYDATGISKKAKKAVVPSTVKIGGKTYNLNP